MTEGKIAALDKRLAITHILLAALLVGCVIAIWMVATPGLAWFVTILAVPVVILPLVLAVKLMQRHLKAKQDKADDA